MADFYYRLGEEVVGPVTGIEFREAAFAGQVVLDTLVSNNAQGPWRIAARVKGLFDERGRPLPHPPEAEQLIAQTRVVGKAVDPPPPPIQIPVRPVNSGPPARLRKHASKRTHLSPALVITAVAIAGAAIIVAVFAIPKRQRPIAVSSRSAPAPTSSRLADSRASTETEHASSLEPDQRQSATDASSPSPILADAKASELQDLEVPNTTDATFAAPREPPFSKVDASVPMPARAESDDETAKPTDSKSLERDLPTLIADLGPSVVLIAKTGSYGSGFVVGKGIVATNYHVIAGGGEAEVWCKDGTLVNVLGTLVLDAKRDLALLQVDAERVRLKPLPMSTIVPPQGQSVFALGYPLGLIGEITPTDGIVSAKRSGDELCGFYKEPRGTYLGTWLQTTAAINKGNSGGPLLDKRGQVVGMSTLSGIRPGDFERADGINFCISSLDLVDALETAKSAVVTPLPKEGPPAVAASDLIPQFVDATDEESREIIQRLDEVMLIDQVVGPVPRGFNLYQFTSSHQFKASIFKVLSENGIKVVTDQKEIDTVVYLSTEFTESDTNWIDVEFSLRIIHRHAAEDRSVKIMRVAHAELKLSLPKRPSRADEWYIHDQQVKKKTEPEMKKFAIQIGRNLDSIRNP